MTTTRSLAPADEDSTSPLRMWLAAALCSLALAGSVAGLGLLFGEMSGPTDAERCAARGGEMVVTDTYTAPTKIGAYVHFDDRDVLGCSVSE